ncbi:MAG: hypothetical protein JKY15_09105 [Deltaproteobacteria bacterium]|nr:hypothetical protein [Deltaproteobacteria bacterium]
MRLLAFITLLALSTSAFSSNSTRPVYCYVADASSQIVDELGMPVVAAWVTLSAISMVLPFIAKIVATVYLSKLVAGRINAARAAPDGETHYVQINADDDDNSITVAGFTLVQRILLELAEYYAPGVIESELRHNYQLGHSGNPNILTGVQAQAIPATTSANARDIIGVFIAIIGTLAYVTQQYTKGLCDYEMQGN